MRPRRLPEALSRHFFLNPTEPTKRTLQRLTCPQEPEPPEDDMSALPASDVNACRDLPRAKVLVAEDHEDSRHLLRTLLERRGLLVVEAADGFEALDAAERERPDLILMDGGLPLLDGIAATRLLRGRPSLAAVPIVFLSGHAAPGAQTAALDAGCDEYVVKPFDIERLDKVLNRHLPRHGGAATQGS